MRSEKQREQSRINGAKSRGPKNRERVRFNALTHRLRADQLILPGEDPAAFDALRDGLFAEWDPETLTRALLVERLAVNTWRLQRATCSDVAYRRVTAEGTAYAFEADKRRRVDEALRLIHDEPTAALGDLESGAQGLDRLIQTWSEMGQALERGPSGWDRPFLHDRLMLAHGRHAAADAALIGPAGRASARLLAAHAPGGAAMAAEEADAAAEDIRRVVSENLARLRALRARAEDPEDQRRRMVEAAMVDETHGAQLRIRYEMAIERSLRSTIKQLMELKRTGADLNGPDADEPGAAGGRGPRCGPAPDTGGPSHQWHPGETGPQWSGATGGSSHQCSSAPDAGGKAQPRHPGEAEAPTPSAQGPEPAAVPPSSGSFGAGASKPSRRRFDPEKRSREDRQRAARRPRKRGKSS